MHLKKLPLPFRKTWSHHALFCTGAALLVLGCISHASAESALWNDDWKFHLGDVADGATPALSDDEWRTLDLPHDWSIEQPLDSSLASATGYLPGGIGWYRKHFHVPAERKGQRLSVYFEGVYNNSEVFLNGHSLGKRPNGYISFEYDLTPYVEFGKNNVLAVKVDHSKDADSRWYTGSGIYRDVHLTWSQPIHIKRWGVGYEAKDVTQDRALLKIDTTVTNTTDKGAEVTVVQELFPRGSDTSVAKAEVAQDVSTEKSERVVQELEVPSPRLWSVRAPNLYTLKTTVLQNGKILDETSTTVGIRTLSFDPNKGFALNGESMKLKGVCIHHDAGVLGSAVPRQVWKRRLETLKSLGCNAIRMSHNPQAPDVYDLCDELGLLVMDEAFDEWRHPKRKWIAGWNRGNPGYDGYAPNFDEWGETDLRDMVLRDRHHPSIIMWSIGNEVDYPNDPYSHPVLDTATIGQKVYGKYEPDRPDAMELGEIARRLVAVVKEVDTSRPVTAALAGVVMSNFTGYPQALDITGYNYTENRYEEDYREYPDRVLYGSENRHGLAEWKAVRDNDYILGQFLWTGIDYLGEAGPWPTRGSSAGLLDLAGFVKPLGRYRESLWSEKPMVHISTHRTRSEQPRRMSTRAASAWNYADGDLVRVICFTNCEDAKLLLNGEPVGGDAQRHEESGVLYWTIPFKPGKLEVVGLNDGEEVARDAIQTTGPATALKASGDRTALSANRDVAHITIEVVDAEGLRVPSAEDSITCEIDGPARLLGLEASNNSDMGDYTDNIEQAHGGRLLAYIETTGEPGKVTVKCSSPDLQPAEVDLDVN